MQTKYNFTTYDREALRESFWLANSRLHDIFERVVPGLFPKELDPKEVLDCVSNLWGMQFDRNFDEGACDYRIRVSFEGASKGTPEVGVLLGLDGMEHWGKRHRVPLSIISNYQKFKQVWGENYFENPKLSDVLLGGVMNMYGKTGEGTTILMLSCVTHWILCGPLFDAFWRTRSFDIHVPMKYQTLADGVKSGALYHWTPSLRYYAANEARIASIREKSREWRETSKSCICFNLETHSFMQNLIQRVKDSGGIDNPVHVPVNLGWNEETRRFENERMKQMETDELLDIIEAQKPAFAIEGNIHSSPLINIYSSGGYPSPRVLLRRMGIPFWTWLVDIIDAPRGFLEECLSKLIVGNNTLFHLILCPAFSSQLGIHYFPAGSLPREFESSAEVSTTGDQNFVRKLKFDKPQGILIAYNTRRGAANTHPLVRKIMCMSALYQAKFLDKIDNPFPTPPLLDAFLLHSTRNGGLNELPFEDYATITGTLGLPQWSSPPLNIKLRIMAQVEDICEKNSIPCRIHTADDWKPSDSGGNWRGYIEGNELNRLGSEGWIRISAYPSDWGAPFHDVHGGMKNGFIALCELGKYPNEEAKEIMKVFSYENGEPESLENCIKRAMNEPHTVYDAILRAMGGVANDTVPPMNPETKNVVANLFRSDCAEPVFSDQQVSDMMIRKCYENVPDDIKQKLKSRELADFIRTCNLDDLCEEAVGWGASRRYIRYAREFLEI